MNNTDINNSSGQPPEDPELRSRIRQNYDGEINKVKAYVPMELIVPFSDYRPEDIEEFSEMYAERLRENKPVAMTVYEKDGKFIMSDDYQTYYFHERRGDKEALCLILGRYTPNDSIRQVDE